MCNNVGKFPSCDDGTIRSIFAVPGYPQDIADLRYAAYLKSEVIFPPLSQKITGWNFLNCRQWSALGINPNLPFEKTAHISIKPTLPLERTQDRA